jgi:hypothetical protein
MPHRSFRPSDFAWRDLPSILVRGVAAPVVGVIRGAGLWPEADAATAGRSRRKTLWRLVLLLWLALPAFCLIGSGLSVYAVGRGWVTRSTGFALASPAHSLMELTPLKSRWEFLLMSLFNRGLADGNRRISDVR